jgi:hypothetical protein
MILLPHFMEDATHYMEVVGALTMSVELYDDLACVLTPSITFWTLDIAIWS